MFYKVSRVFCRFYRFIAESLINLNFSGISNHEIVVVVVYDGIDKIRVDTDNDKNMFLLFKDCDRQFQIPETDRM